MMLLSKEVVQLKANRVYKRQTAAGIPLPHFVIHPSSDIAAVLTDALLTGLASLQSQRRSYRSRVEVYRAGRLLIERILSRDGGVGPRTIESICDPVTNKYRVMKFEMEEVQQLFRTTRKWLTEPAIRSVVIEISTLEPDYRDTKYAETLKAFDDVLERTTGYLRDGYLILTQRYDEAFVEEAARINIRNRSSGNLTDPTVPLASGTAERRQGRGRI
jgi:hypothetical protein